MTSTDSRQADRLPSVPDGTGREEGLAWPQQAAVALAYSQDDAAPRVLAKGRGLLAQAIIERARHNGVFVHESRELVALLMQVDLDQRIPPALYRAVAELLLWVYQIEQRPF